MLAALITWRMYAVRYGDARPHWPGHNENPPSALIAVQSLERRDAPPRGLLGLLARERERAAEIGGQQERQRARRLLLGAVVRILVDVARASPRPTSAVEARSTVKPPAPGSMPAGIAIFSVAVAVVSP